MTCAAKLLLWAAFVSSASAAERWFSTETGSVEMVTDAPQRQALQTLGQVEQLRYAIGELLGNPALAFRPKLRLLVLKSTEARAELTMGRSRLMLPLQADAQVGPAVFNQLARELLAHGTTRLPGELAEGMASFLSTVEVRGAHVVWGAPPAASQRTVAWARIHLLATQPAYSGRLRVILFNLQKGVAEDPAFRNATGKSAAEFTAEAEKYRQAGQFATADAPSRTFNVQRDLKVKTLTEADGRLAVADLLDRHSEAAYRGFIEAKSHMAEAYEGLGQLALLRGDRPGALDDFGRAVELESNEVSLWIAYAQAETDRVKAGDAIARALELDPESAEAHYLQGVRKDDPVQLELATTFEPQNWRYWDALATAYLDQNRFADAAKAWRSAEQNAPDSAVRSRMETAWKGMENKRLDFDTAQRRQTAAEQQARTDALKTTALGQLRAAEARVSGNSTGDAGPAPVPWDEVMPVELKGTLKLVECLGAKTRVTIAAPDGNATKLTVKLRKGLVCASAPNQAVAVEYLKRPDEKLGTAGEIEKLP